MQGTQEIARSIQRSNRRSLPETDVLLAEEMILRRRLMQRQDEAIAVVSPMLILVPVRAIRKSEQRERGRREVEMSSSSFLRFQLTDIAPDWSMIPDVIPPDYGGDEVSEASHESPDDEGEGSHVSRAKVGEGGNEEEDHGEGGVDDEDEVVHGEGGRGEGVGSVDLSEEEGR